MYCGSLEYEKLALNTDNKARAIFKQKRPILGISESFLGHHTIAPDDIRAKFIAQFSQKGLSLMIVPRLVKLYQ